MTEKTQPINFNLSEIANGGSWKNEALQNIKVFLQKALSDEIKNQRVVVIA